MSVKRLNLNAQSAVGGIEQTTIYVGTIACRIRQLKAVEKFVGGKDGVVSTHRVYSTNAITIQNKDHLIIDGLVYDVNTINPGSSKKGYLEIDVTLRA